MPASMTNTAATPLKVLVLGAYGLIGGEIVRRLVADGHTVIGFGRQKRFSQIRPGMSWRTADMATLTTPALWRPFLENIDAIVNAAGALQSGPRDDLARTQRDAICALIEAAGTHGVKTFVQISAPGATPEAKTEFLRTKGEADEALRRSGLAWVILRPGLVIAETAHGGTSLVRALAAVPLLQPLVLPDAIMHTVDIKDVAAATARCLSDPSLARNSFDLGETTSHSLKDIVLAFRRWLGFAPPAAIVAIPDPIARTIARCADLAGLLGWRAPMRTTAFDVLRDDVLIDPEPWRRATGETLSTLQQTLTRLPATRQERSFARIELIFPVLVVAFALFWIASGLIGLAQRSAATALIEAQLGSLLANVSVIAGSLLDISIGTTLLTRKYFRSACLAAAGTSLAYMILGSVLTPGLWADPLGPLAKIIPTIGLALMLAAYAEER